MINHGLAKSGVDITMERSRRFQVVDQPSYESARLVDVNDGHLLTTWAANCRTGFRQIAAENTDCGAVESAMAIGGTLW